MLLIVSPCYWSTRAHVRVISGYTDHQISEWKILDMAGRSHIVLARWAHAISDYRLRCSPLTAGVKPNSDFPKFGGFLFRELWLNFKSSLLICLPENSLNISRTYRSMPRKLLPASSSTSGMCLSDCSAAMIRLSSSHSRNRPQFLPNLKHCPWTSSHISFLTVSTYATSIT